MSEHENYKKIPDKYENPIDIYVIKLADYITPLLFRMKFTPNIITFIGLIIGIICIYMYSINKTYFAFILFWVSYFFDCLDGHFARKYNMETQFGDYFDHFRDIFVLGIMSILIIYKSDNKILTACIIIVFFGFTILHMSCQEKNSEYIENNNSLKSITICKRKKYINFTKYVGCGTFILIVSLLLLKTKNNYIK
jgi:phosphatidylglycerophosphate synthase